jgi:hypothetical protein
VDKDTVKNSRLGKMPIQTPMGILVKGMVMLDENRERRGETEDDRMESGELEGRSKGNRAQEALAESVRRDSLGTTRPVYSVVLCR